MTSGLKQSFVLRIDKEGKWYYDGRQIIHPNVLRIFNDGLFVGPDGNHYLRVEGDLAVVEVEDAPFVVNSLSPVMEGDTVTGFLIKLSDDTRQYLDLESLVIDEKNVPYCNVRGELLARFSSQAYYMLAEYIEYREREDAYYIRSGMTEYPVSYRGERS